MILVKLQENPHSLQKQTFTPPLGLWSMRTNRNGEPVQVLDAHLLGREEVDRQINERKDQQILGISAQFSTQEDELLRMVEKWQDRFPITVGGPFGGLQNLSRAVTYFGWGERYLNPRIASFKDVRPPVFSEEEITPYWKRGAPHGLKHQSSRWMTIETSRGCVYECGFCDMPSFWGRWDPRPLDQLEEHLRWLKDQIGIDEVFIEDDNISLNQDRFIKIIWLLHDLQIKWSCPNGIFARSLLSSPVLHALSRSTCWSLSLPFETGSASSASLMKLGRKWLTFEEADLLVKDLNIMGIETTGFFVIGYVGESEDDVKRTLAYANALPLKSRHIYLAAPYKGTELYRLCLKNNWLADGPATYRSALVDTPFLSSKRLLELFNEDRTAALERKKNGHLA